MLYISFLFSAGSKSTKSKFNGSLVVLYCAFIMFRTLCPGSNSSCFISSAFVEWCIYLMTVLYAFSWYVIIFVCFWCPAGYFNNTVCQTVCVILFIFGYVSYSLYHFSVAYNTMCEYWRSFFGLSLNLDFRPWNLHLFHLLTSHIGHVFLFLFKECCVVYCVFSSFQCTLSLAIHFGPCVSSSSSLVDVILSNC